MAETSERPPSGASPRSPVPATSPAPATLPGRRDGFARMPCKGALAVALIPFATLCFSVPWWDRIEPIVLGLPFNLFWLGCWQVSSAGCLWVAYRLEASRDRRGPEPSPERP